MEENELFTQPHDELLRVAIDLGFADVSDFTKWQLAHAIAVARAAQKHGKPYAQTPRVVFRPLEQKQTALIRNPIDRPVRLTLELVDSTGAFTIPDDLKNVLLQPCDALSVPVRFSPTIKGIPTTSSTPYNAGIDVWDREANCIVARVHLLGTGPGYQIAPCVVSPEPKGSRDELPNVYLVIKPEWTDSYTRNVQVRYRISGNASEVTLCSGDNPAHIMEDNEGPTSSESWCGPSQPIAYPPGLNYYEREYNIIQSGMSTIDIVARNAAGQATSRGMVGNVLHPIGYQNARTPGQVYRSTINALSGFLSEIETKLKEGAFTKIADLAKFPNSSYLYYDLPGEILVKMKGVIIFRHFYGLPSVGRYAINYDDPNNPTNWWLTERQRPERLCYWNPPVDNPGCTFWFKDQTGLHRDWIGLCYQNFPPLYTPILPLGRCIALLHELYHYAVREDQISWDPNDLIQIVNYQTSDLMTMHVEEAKAYVISQGCHFFAGGFINP